MKKKNLLLKVVSIVFTVSSVIGLGSSIALLAMADEFLQSVETAGMDVQMYEAMLAPAAMTIAIVSSLVGMAAGILGILEKNLKACVITMIIYIVLAIISIIQMSSYGDVSIGSTFLFPILYLLGVYMVKK